MTTTENIQPPLVSIRCTVYNHEPYLRDCLEGFVMQKTTFPFEAIVHDDASTDGSADIIREYAEKYPHIIKPIYQTVNQYSQGKGGVAKAIEAVMSPDSKYIALCEGDDYWIDPNKLQMQVDWLEKHADFTMCFHNVKIEAMEECLRHQYDNLQTREYSSDEILSEWTVPTCSAVLRKEIYFSLPKDSRFLCGDIVWFLTAANMGRIYCMNKKCGVYRRLVSGMTMAILSQQNNIERWIHHYQALQEHFPKVKKTATNLATITMVKHLRHLWSCDKMKSLYYCMLYVCIGRMRFVHKLCAWLKVCIIKRHAYRTE